MKKLELKNLKVVKLSKEEKSKVNGGKMEPIVWNTSGQCNTWSGPYVAWCHPG